MSLFYATKYRRLPDGRQKRVESIGFSGLVAALATVRDMNEVVRPGEVWIVTTRIDGAHVPAVIAAGVYDLERGEELEPAA